MFIKSFSNPTNVRDIAQMYKYYVLLILKVMISNEASTVFLLTGNFQNNVQSLLSCRYKNEHMLKKFWPCLVLLSG